MKRGKIKKRRISVARIIENEFGNVNQDLNFWLHHVLHWHLLLAVLIIFLSYNYFK